MIRSLAMLLLALPIAASAEGPVQATVGDDGVQRLEITGGSYYFEPAHVVVRAGQPVELTLRKASGLAPHDFHIDAPDTDIDVHAELGSDPVTVSFTPTATGRFEFRCTKNPPLLRSHDERGMHGVLEVIE